MLNPKPQNLNRKLEAEAETVLKWNPEIKVDFSFYALNSILLFTLFLSNFIFQLFLSIFREGVRIEPPYYILRFFVHPF